MHYPCLCKCASCLSTKFWINVVSYWKYHTYCNNICRSQLLCNKRRWCTGVSSCMSYLAFWAIEYYNIWFYEKGGQYFIISLYIKKHKSPYKWNHHHPVFVAASTFLIIAWNIFFTALPAVVFGWCCIIWTILPWAHIRGVHCEPPEVFIKLQFSP